MLHATARASRRRLPVRRVEFAELIERHWHHRQLSSLDAPCRLALLRRDCGWLGSAVTCLLMAAGCFESGSGNASSHGFCAPLRPFARLRTLWPQLLRLCAIPQAVAERILDKRRWQNVLGLALKMLVTAGIVHLGELQQQTPLCSRALSRVSARGNQATPDKVSSISFAFRRKLPPAGAEIDMTTVTHNRFPLILVA